MKSWTIKFKVKKIWWKLVETARHRYQIGNTFTYNQGINRKYGETMWLTCVSKSLELFLFNCCSVLFMLNVEAISQQ